MSLQVWLPLTKDLRQQGLANTSSLSLVSGNNLTNGGKIGGQCLVLTKRQTILGNNSCMTNKKQMSYAYWVKVNTAWSANWLDGIRYITTDGTSTHTSRQEFYTNCTRVGTWFQGSSLSGYVFTPEEWTHLVGTFDYSTGVAKFYINGELKGTSTALDTTHYCRGDFYLGDDGIDISMNDVRIYDHCLSPMEVKELAKGLVVHYPLNRQGWGQENLLRGSNVIGSGTTTYGWVSNGSATNMEILSDGSLHYKYNVSNSKYIPSITTNTVVPCEFSKTYFYSMDLKFDKAITLGTSVPAHYWIGARNSDSITNINCNGNLTGIQTQFISNHSGTLPANTWVHITTKFTFPAAATSSGYNYPAIRCFVYGSVLTETTTGEVNVWMKNCKVEEGSIETPWCPHIEDTLATTMGLNSATEYDCSGFGNNGTRTGTFTWSSDTPKYNVSTQLNSTSTKIAITGLTTTGFANSYSFAWWAKKVSNWYMDWGFSDGIRLNGMYTGHLWNTGDGSDNPLYNIGTTTQVTDPTLNVWHHYVMTGNGSKCYVYKDGVLWAEAKTYKAISGTTIYINGWNSSTSYSHTNYQMSDFRIYATALSAADVKSLYQNCATIGSNGIIYGQIRS